MSTVIVGGAGHVGLPLGIALAKAGEEVTAYDINLDAIRQINEGIVPFLEEEAEPSLREVLKSGYFKASNNRSCIAKASTVILVLGTPVDEFLSPNPNEIIDVCKELIPFLKSGQSLILRSTVFPGVTKKIEQALLMSGLEVLVTYCPERILEGQALSEIQNLPQIIGIRDISKAKSILDYFAKICSKSIVCSPEEAELAKIFTNVWRYTKFAIANQFWIIANELNVDYAKVNKVITYEYPRAKDVPMPGFTAGPCLFKDTAQLSAILSRNFALGTTAMMINEGVPSYLVDKIKEKYDLSRLTVGILGASFKAESDDIRGSLAFKLRKILKFQCDRVLISDPLVTDNRLVEFEYIVKESDLLIIATPHSIFKNRELKQPVIDIWNLLGKGVMI